ncbi:hypothetical protein Dsin_032748 [Dipteronia sinensis]|uniref:DJ-1/PfpI domain-containing protein n=1 Tax=Dipteronia sinensis TaxID=43782 RepID=A0AAD9ZJU7_9ROSI|nr:hypothetical protein Dsin_032748 [Dipteronia sinensis]
MDRSTLPIALRRIFLSAEQNWTIIRLINRCCTRSELQTTISHSCKTCSFTLPMSHPKPKMAKSMKILFLLYDGMNTLDVNGPLDVLCNYALRSQESATNPAPFVVKTACKSDDKIVKAYEYITMKADYTFSDAIKEIGKGEVDILMVPGGISTPIDNMIDNNDPILDVISTFIDAPKDKWLVSICTGALLCGAAGGFKGVNATTHFKALGGLANVTKHAPPLSITRQRWVDGGYLPGQDFKTRVISSGGISCGLDASLYVVQQVLGSGKAWAVADMMDLNWNVQWTKPTNPLLPPPSTYAPTKGWLN